ncbi:MAG: YchF/TatD family DNA exonuclease [Nitrospirota bacterium]|nr:YchF/TatD family DNA exonuclease [Nitrospirota bacterium]
MLVDTHAHLEMTQFDGDREAVLERARAEGLLYIISVGSDLDGSRGAVQLAREHDFVHASVGIHPHEVKDITEATYDELRELAKDPKVVAWGEIGLDYHYLYSPMEVQQARFREQTRLAREFKLPVIIHDREAHDDTMRILREEKAGENGGILHCFSGDAKMAKDAIEMGFLISIAGPVTFKKSDDYRRVVSEIPIESLLIETDSPYLAPEPLRGKRNEPAYVKYVAETIAKVKGLTVQDVARITTLNAMTLFGIGDIEKEGRIAYRIRDSLYLNVTNRCTNTCTFCVRYYTDFVKGHNLRLTHEPTAEELIKAIGDPTLYREVVFCGYGEPLLRLDVVKTVAKWIKERGVKVRINTNGHGNVIHKRNILPELAGLVDCVSVSLNTDTEEQYIEHCQPAFTGAYQAMKDFIRLATEFIPEVVATALTLPTVDIDECRRIAEGLGARLRVRELDVVG